MTTVNARPTHEGLTVGQLATESSVAPSAIRFYESHGLLPGRRTPGNQRRYDPHLACWVKVVRVCQRVGLSVAEIRDLLAPLPRESEPTPKDWSKLNERLEAELRARMSELQILLDDLSSEEKMCELPTIDDLHNPSARAM